MTEVVEVNRIEVLRSYHLAWKALHAETPRASFFQTFEWLENYWRHNQEGQHLRVLIIEADGRPIGIVPLVERTEPSRLGPIRVLTYPLDAWGSWYGPIGVNQTAILALAMKHLKATPRTWDVFAPRWIAHESSDRGRTEQAMRLAGFAPTVESEATTSVIEFDRFADWEAYLASRSTKVRHELRRQRRRLAEEGELELIRCRPEPHACGDGEPNWEVYYQCLGIAERSWQAVSRNGNTLCHGSVSAMLADAHEIAARLGMVDMSLLTIDGTPAAYYYGYHHEGRVYGLRTGYDSTVASGAGAVLLGMLVEESFERGDVSLDLGAGGEHYKRRLRTTVENSTRLTYVAPQAWRPQALRAARWCAKRLRWAA